MNDISEIKRKSVSGVVGYAVRSALLYGIAVGATALLSAFLSPADFGVYFVVTAVIGVFTFLSDVGLAAALIQKKDTPTLTELRTSFTVQQFLALLILGVIISLTPVWRRHSHLDHQGLWLLYALGSSFILASFKTIPSILLERKLQFNNLVIPQLVEQIIFYTLAVLLAYKGWGITSFTIAVIVRSLSGVIVIYLLQPWSIGLAFSKVAFRNLFKFGLKFQANDLLARLKDDLFIVVLGKFLPITQMGYLGWAKRWSMFPYQFSVQNVIAITFPTFSRLQHDHQLIAKGLELSLYFIGLIIFPILIGMSLLAYPLTQAIPAYTKWQPALPALYFFCLNIGFAAIANPFINALNAMGKINTTLKLMIVMTMGTWILTPFGWHYWGIVGVAFVAALIAGFSLYSLRVFSQIIPINIWHSLKISLIASTFMAIILYWSRTIINPNISGLILLITIGFVSYAGCIYVFGFNQLVNRLKQLYPKWQ